MAEPRSLPSDAVERLLAAANGDAALLYLAILHSHGAAEAEKLAVTVTLIHGISSIFIWVPAFMVPGFLRAAGDAKYTMTVAVFSMAVFRIGFGVFLATTMGMGVIGVWIAMQIDWVFRIICFLIRWHSGKWQTKTLV